MALSPGSCVWCGNTSGMVWTMSLVSPPQIITTSCRGTPDALWHDVSAELESQFSRAVVVYHSLAQHDLESLKHSRAHDGCSRSSAVTEVSVGISTVSQTHTGAVATHPVGAKARSPDALSHRANAPLTHIASEVAAYGLAWCQVTAPQMSTDTASVLSSSRSSVEWWS